MDEYLQAVGALATVSGVLYLWPRRSGPPRRELARAEKLLETLGVSENRTVVFGRWALPSRRENPSKMFPIPSSTR